MCDSNVLSLSPNRYGYGLEYQYDPAGTYERQKGYGFVKAYGREFCKEKANCPPADSGQLEHLNHLNHLNAPTNLIKNSESSSSDLEAAKSAEGSTNAADNLALTRPPLSSQLPVKADNELNKNLDMNQNLNMNPNKNNMDDIARFYHSQKNAPLPDTLHLVRPHAPSPLVNHFSVNNKILDGLSSNGVSFRSKFSGTPFDSINLASDSSSETVSSIRPSNANSNENLRSVSSDSRLPSDTSKLGHINLLSHIKHGIGQLDANRANSDQRSVNESESAKENGSSKENELSKESETPKQNSQLIDTNAGRQPIRLASNHHEFDNDDEHLTDYDVYRIEPYGSQYRSKSHYDPFAERFDRLPKIVHPAAKQLKKHHSSFESSDNYKNNYKNYYKSDLKNDFKSDYDDLDSHLLGATRLRFTRLQPKFIKPDRSETLNGMTNGKPVSEATVLPSQVLLDKRADGGNDLNETPNENQNEIQNETKNEDANKGPAANH